MEARRLRALAVKVSNNERVIEQDLQRRLTQKTDLIQSQLQEDRNQFTEQTKRSAIDKLDLIRV
jgi:hypothetical protein